MAVAAFMKELKPVGPLAEIIGDKPITRVRATSKIWAYIKRNKLQDAENSKLINTDGALRRVFGGKAQVSLFEITKYMSKYLGDTDDDGSETYGDGEAEEALPAKLVDRRKPKTNERKSVELEAELTAALLDAYQAAGEGVGYWARRYLQALMRNGGLSTAKRMLLPRTESQRKGLDTLLAANRPDLTVEAIVLQPRFQVLFTEEELAVAKERLGDYGKRAAQLKKHRDRLFPDELEPGTKYIEGARKQVRVNAYERDPRARAACIKHHGASCTVCGFSFESRYGELGKGFIHVHHLKPLALIDGQYELDPVADLRPVCPNCHAMLHRAEEVLSIEALRERLDRTASRRKQ